MDIIVANARQLSSIQLELYEWKKLDAIYARLTDTLLATLKTMWTSAGYPVARHVTPAEIEAAAHSVTASRFFPSLNYAPNPVNWDSLKPYCPPVLQGYNLEDGAALVGTPNAQIAAVGAIAYQWIVTRLHRSEGTLQRIALLQKGIAISKDALAINTMLSDAFAE